MIILGVWSLSMMAIRAQSAARCADVARHTDHSRQRRDEHPAGGRARVCAADRSDARRATPALLPRALLAALDRFAATRNVQDVAAAAETLCDAEADRLDSEMSMIRYIAWAIPAIGFIGTVRGIGESLGQAYRAAAGDVSGVTEGLGVAFNATFIALTTSILLMFFLHQLQLLQERLVLDTRTYIDQRLIRHLQVR